MPIIKSVDARLFRVPLPEVMSDAKHGDHTHFELITATVHLVADGSQGHWLQLHRRASGGQAILAMLRARPRAPC